ncbi:hypothetical protein ACWDTG_26000 [Rhodococcus zopfii]
MSKDGWEFWRVTRASDGVLAWLAVTRPGARAVVDRQKVWTLLPNSLVFIANWLVTEDFRRDDDASIWEYENIDSGEAHEVALEVPQPSADEIARLTRPESCLTLNQIDRHPLNRLLGKRVADDLAVRARLSRSAGAN